MEPRRGSDKAVRKSGFIFLVMASLTVASVGCVPATPHSKVVAVEYQSPQEAAIDAVLETNTDFIVEHGEEAYANERLLFFFRKFLSTTPKRSATNSASGELILSGSSTNYVYSVRKLPDAKGVFYQVRCTPRVVNQQTQESADINARNLARFISKGSLENRVVVR